MDITYLSWNELSAPQKHTLETSYGDVAAWLMMPRARPSMILSAWVAQTVVGLSVLTHDRVSVGSCIIDVAVNRRLVVAPDVPAALRVELAMTHAGHAFDDGLGILLVDGAVADWSPYGFAPVSYPVVTTWATRPPRVAVQPGTVATTVLDAELAGAIADIARARPLRSVAVVDSASHTPATWLVVRGRDGQLRAAARIEQAEHGGVVVRRAVAGDDGAAGDLVDALLADPTLPTPRFELPLDHPLTRMALFSGAHTMCHAAAPTGLLAGIIDLPTMLTALIPAFRSRIAGSLYHDWVGGVRLEISDERAMIMLDHGNVSVIDGTREAAVRLRSIELPALAQLCFGYRSVSALRRAGLLQCDDTELTLLELLFPVLQPTFGWEH